MSKLINVLWSQYLRLHRAQMQAFMDRPIESQNRELRKIIRTSVGTEWGSRYGFSSFRKTADWKTMLPIQDYESVKGDIHRMMAGERNVLWPGRVRYYAKSSGTTADKSKYIPVTNANHHHCHTRGGWRLLASMYENVKDPKIVEGKSILLAGSSNNHLQEFPGSIVGDVSAIIYQRMNPLALNRLYPDKDIALLPDFEKKLEIYKALGFDGVQFHDDDAVPVLEGKNAAQNQINMQNAQNAFAMSQTAQSFYGKS